jgi:hypothetical protein
LFQRGQQSGWTICASPVDDAFALAQNVGAYSGEIAEIAQQRRQPADQIAEPTPSSLLVSEV